MNIRIFLGPEIQQNLGFPNARIVLFFFDELRPFPIFEFILVRAFVPSFVLFHLTEFIDDL